MNTNETIAFIAINLSVIILTGIALWITGSLWSLFILLFMGSFEDSSKTTTTQKE